MSKYRTLKSKIIFPTVITIFLGVSILLTFLYSTMSSLNENNSKKDLL